MYPSEDADYQLNATDLLEAVVSNAPIVLFATDPQGTMTLSRGKALDALGVAQGELVGQSVFDLYVSEPAVADAARQALEGESVTARLDLDGVVHETLFAPLQAADGQRIGLLGIATDITERVRAEEELHYRVTRNPATGLLNRGYWLDELNRAVQQATEEASALSVFVIVQDRFHEVSETFGYESGSVILQEAAQRLRDLRLDGAVLGAIEAGKFAVFMPGGIRHASSAAREIAAALARPFDIAGQSLYLTPLIGVSAFPGHGDHADVLLRNAEVAARTPSHDDVPYTIYSSRPVDPRRNFMLLSDLRRAIRNDGLRMEYQPLINLKTMTTDSVEALVRWDHLTLGAIPPDQFVPLAEEAGIMHELSGLVFDEVAQQCYRWEREGLHMRVAINVSPLEFVDGDFTSRLRMAMESWGVSLSDLTIEVTERVNLGHLNGLVLERLRSLKDANLELAIDDFGTGYSNIANLQQLPYGQVKIDRSFLADVNTSPDARQIVGAMVELGHALGRTIVAEGVETPEIWDAASELSCDLVQGYHIARPMRPDALPGFLEHSGWN